MNYFYPHDLKQSQKFKPKVKIILSQSTPRRREVQMQVLRFLFLPEKKIFGLCFERFPPRPLRLEMFCLSRKWRINSVELVG